MASSRKRVSICVPCNVSPELLDAYANDEEDFFGLYDEQHVVLPEINEDEEELVEDISIEESTDIS